MPVRQIDLPEIGTIKLYKRRGLHSIKISLSGGDLRVSMPTWTPYKTALGFVVAQKDWIIEQKSRHDPEPLRHGQTVGKAHHLLFMPTAGQPRPQAKIKQNQIQILHSPSLGAGDKTIQETARKACLKAVKKEADQLLPQRLTILAARHGFEFGNVSTRNLKSRWGSCNRDRDITLNIFLMQLPWHLIDYVILHELTHTKVMRHGPPFWAELEKYLPDARACRKEIGRFEPSFSIQTEKLMA